MVFKTDFGWNNKGVYQVGKCSVWFSELYFCAEKMSKTKVFERIVALIIRPLSVRYEHIVL